MRPCDIYAMPTLAEEDWARSTAVAIMFGPENAFPVSPHASEVPLGVLTKVAAKDLDHDPDEGPVHRDEVTWQVLTWEGEPFGVVVEDVRSGERHVTDAALYRRAHMRIVELGLYGPGLGVVEPDRDVPGLGSAGGRILVREGGEIRPVPRQVCVDGVPLVDVGRLAATLPRGRVPGTAGPDMRALREAALACVAPGTRRTADYDIDALLARFPPSAGSRWMGPLVATGDATYLLCLGEAGSSVPLNRALGRVRVGDASMIDALATGPIIEPEGASPRP